MNYICLYIFVKRVLYGPEICEGHITTAPTNPHPNVRGREGRGHAFTTTSNNHHATRNPEPGTIAIRHHRSQAQPPPARDPPTAEPVYL